jgi:hypothetical protein
MNEEQLKKIIEGTYDDSEEDSLLSMVGQLYSRKMLPSMFILATYLVPCLAGAIYCGIKFFMTDQSQFQLMYAAIFICCVQGIFTSKVKYWQMFHKNNISREIKRLELRIAELNETIDNK